jgi:enoyl-CoA hydratase/carnithine racemase
MTQGDFTSIDLEVDPQGVALLTLDRPDRLNAFNPTMQNELIAAFDRTDADDNVRAVVVTGRGRAFCAGADLSTGGQTFDYEARGHLASGRMVDGKHRDGGGLVTLRIFDSLKPVVAAINGPAVGVGVSMTLPMDVRLAADTARMGFVFARRGIVPDAAASWFLPRLVGVDTALEWCFSGRVFDAEEALQRRLIRATYPADELVPAARALALCMVDSSAPVSVALTRQMIWRMLGAADPMDAHRADSRALTARGASADAREGVTAFLDKRPADFPGRVSTDLPDVWEQWPHKDFA